jgi:inosine-uridine nucleoside N-ribohydrolase
VARPELLELRALNVEIDCESTLCRGRTVVDVWGRSGREPNTNVAVGIDADGFIELLLERLGGLDR